MKLSGSTLTSLSFILLLNCLLSLSASDAGKPSKSTSLHGESYESASAGSQEKCRLGAVDLVFVLDESTSVGLENFKKLLETAAELTNALEVGTGPAESQVGSVIFSSHARIGFPLQEHKTNAEVRNAIQKLEYEGGSKKIFMGMKRAIQMFHDAERVERVPRIMLIMTDAGKESSTAIVAQYERASKYNITTLAIGIGRGVDQSQLAKATGNSDNVFLSEDYTVLQRVASSVCKVIEQSVALFATFQPRTAMDSDLQGISSSYEAVESTLPSTSASSFKNRTPQQDLGLPSTTEQRPTAISPQEPGFVTQFDTATVQSTTVPFNESPTSLLDQNTSPTKEQVTTANSTSPQEMADSTQSGINTESITIATTIYPSVTTKWTDFTNWEADITTLSPSAPTLSVQFNTPSAENDVPTIDVFVTPFSDEPPPTTDEPADGGASCGCDSDSLNNAKYWLDMIFIIDSSNNVSKQIFSEIHTLLKYLRHLGIEQPEGHCPSCQYNRVAIINAADTAVQIADLRTARNSSELNELVESKLTYLGGNDFNVAEALKIAKGMIEEENKAKRRLNAKKAIVIFSSKDIECRDGNVFRRTPCCVDCLCDTFSDIEANLATFITVALKNRVTKQFPKIDIAKNCYTLSDPLTMMQGFFQALCYINCYCPSPYTQYENDDGCSKYAECIYVHQIRETANDARSVCSDSEATLSIEQSKEKAEFTLSLHVLLDTVPYWVGEQCNESGICWYDDGTRVSVNTDYWCTGPNITEGHCVYRRKCGVSETALVSAPCGDSDTTPNPKYPFSCQKQACSVKKYCDVLSVRPR